MLTNEEIIDIAMQQSAIDSTCSKNDFINSESKVVVSRSNPGARKYLDYYEKQRL